MQQIYHRPSPYPSIRVFTSIFILLILAWILPSCLKTEFDAPPPDGEDPLLQVNMSIASLKQLYTQGSYVPLRIDSDYIIQGIVISSDKEGNFYKSLVIQDSTAGINIRIDQTNLYTEYPVGRRIYVKCRGLWLGEYEGLIQLGGSADYSDPQKPGVDYIYSTIIDKHIFKGKYNISIEPATLTIPMLNSNYQNMMIRLENVEFRLTDARQPFADPINKLSKNRVLVDCNGNQIFLRTSGYARFAGDSTPCSSGTIVAIYSEFRNDKQLYIRDLNDIMFNAPRCSGPCGVGQFSIKSIRSLYNGSDMSIPSGITITGIVISDRQHGNFDAKNLVIQDTSAGIVVRFQAPHSFSLGDEVEINISEQQLTTFNGLLEINNVPLENATLTGTGIIVPRSATVAQVLANSEAWESTLIKISGAQFSGGNGRYSGTIYLNDGTGNLKVYTRSSASFANTTYPASGNLTVTGVLGDYNGAQLQLRSTADVQQ